MANSPDQPTESQPPPGRTTGPAAPHTPAAPPERLAEQSLESAQAAADEISRQTAEAPSTRAAAAGAASVQLPNFEKQAPANNGEPSALSMLNDIDLHVKVELGRTRMYIEDVLKLNANSIVELDKAAGDPVDIYVNDRHVARGEVLVLSDNFCVRVSEIIKQGGEDE